MVQGNSGGQVRFLNGFKLVCGNAGGSLLRSTIQPSQFHQSRSDVLSQSSRPQSPGPVPRRAVWKIHARLCPETKHILGVAFEMVCIALRIEDSDDGVKQAIATKIIELVKSGERNPDTLCEQALKDIRSPPPQV